MPRRRTNARVSSGVANASAEGEIYRALQMSDPVWHLCITGQTIADTLEAAVSLRLPLATFIDRVKGFAAAGRLKATFKRYCFVVAVDPSAALPAFIATAAKIAAAQNHSHVQQEILLMRATFGVYAKHAERLRRQRAEGEGEVSTAAAAQGQPILPAILLPGLAEADLASAGATLWEPVPPAMGKGAAMDLIADFFHRAHDGELPSAIYAAKILLGAIDWTHPQARHPYAGKLKDHDPEWIVKACGAAFADHANERIATAP